MKKRRRRRFVQISMLFVGLSLLPICLCSASIIEMAYGTRLVPWSAYPSCGETTPETLPKTVRIGFYEEFPVPWRLETLSQIDFPVSLAVTASSRAEFLQLRESIWATYPQVETVYFWPILSKDEGYYPGRGRTPMRCNKWQMKPTDCRRCGTWKCRWKWQAFRQ
jgi:hypothetical protein